MGGGLAGRIARQHPDLTAPLADHRLRVVVLILLALDGVVSAILATLFLPLYIGAVPFPISALLSGLLNTALVWAAMSWVQSNRLAALPIWTWLLTVGVFTFGGPGGDIMFSSAGLGGFGVLVLLVFGAGLPTWLLWRGRPSLERAG